MADVRLARDFLAERARDVMASAEALRDLVENGESVRMGALCPPAGVAFVAVYGQFGPTVADLSESSPVRQALGRTGVEVWAREVLRLVLRWRENAFVMDETLHDPEGTLAAHLDRAMITILEAVQLDVETQQQEVAK